MSEVAVTPPPEHDCPHCAEARAISEELRKLLVEGHALLARLKHAEMQPTTDFHPHDAGVDPKAETDLIPKGFTDVR